MAHRIAACVVLYHPAPQVADNIKSYAPFVDCLIVIDNSDEPTDDWNQRLQGTAKDIIYLPQKKNTGIAKPLNTAASIAIEKDFEWLLTMDQDSRFAEGSMTQMIADIDEIKSLYNNVGIITPLHLLTEEGAKASGGKFTLKKTAITSGNLLSLAAYQSVGAFDEKLFIDFVDHEYCLRLRKHNYKIIQDNEAQLQHSLGNFEIRHFLGKTIGVSHHNYLRRYYMTRNGLYVARKYFGDDVRFFSYMLFEHYIISPVYITFFETDKLRKLKAIARGTIDFILGKSGSKSN